MKTIIFKITMTSCLILGFKQQLLAQEVTTGAQISFEKDSHNFGEVPIHGNTTYTFEFKNTGNEPLVIQQVKAPCSCTVADWPKEPVLPGKKASIQVKYDSNRVGPINKSFQVLSNASNEPSKSLFIKGKVLPAVETTSTLTN